MKYLPFLRACRIRLCICVSEQLLNELDHFDEIQFIISDDYATRHNYL